MNPHEMSNEKLIEFFTVCEAKCRAGGHVREAETFATTVARLRSIDGMIPRPRVEVVETESFDPRDRYQTELNGHCVGIHGTKDNAELQASCYRMYLGMEGSEG